MPPLPRLQSFVAALCACSLPSRVPLLLDGNVASLPPPPHLPAQPEVRRVALEGCVYSLRRRAGACLAQSAAPSHTVVGHVYGCHIVTVRGLAVSAVALS